MQVGYSYSGAESYFNLSRLTCLDYPVQRHSWCHVPDVMPQLYCHSCPAMVVLSQLYCLSLQSCLGFSLSAVLPQHSCPQLFSRCSVFVVMLSLPCTICLVPFMPCPRSPVLKIPRWLSCPVLAVQGHPYIADQKLKNWSTNERKNSFSRDLS